MKIDITALTLAPICSRDEPRYRELMAKHHYLGDLPKIGHTLWYVVTYEENWIALVTFSVGTF